MPYFAWRSGRSLATLLRCLPLGNSLVQTGARGHCDSRRGVAKRETEVPPEGTSRSTRASRSKVSRHFVLLMVSPCNPKREVREGALSLTTASVIRSHRLRFPAKRETEVLPKGKAKKGRNSIVALIGISFCCCFKSSHSSSEDSFTRRRRARKGLLAGLLPLLCALAPWREPLGSIVDWGWTDPIDELSPLSLFGRVLAM